MNSSERVFVLEAIAIGLSQSENSRKIEEKVDKREKIAVSLYERGATMMPYEEMSVSWMEISLLTQAVLDLFNKANGLHQGGFNYSLDLKRFGQKLYNSLLPERIQDKLKNVQVKHLMILMDEHLVEIPWELLHDSHEFWCLKFNLGRSVKTKQTPVQVRSKELKNPIKLLILADPTGDLPSARKEAQEIIKQLDTLCCPMVVSSRVQQISIEYVKKNIQDYDILHYAGHTDYNFDESSQSGLGLVDGKLTLQDILELGKNRSFPLLVFLNSCQSAHEKVMHVSWGIENQLFGFANAFLLCGVKHFVGCLWEIPDHLSSVMAKEFYLNLGAGQTVGEALREARLSLVKKLGDHQLVWGSYILYGDPNVRLVVANSKNIFSFLKNIAKAVMGILVLGILIGIGFHLRYSKIYQMHQFLRHHENVEALTLAKEILDQNPQSFPAYDGLVEASLRLDKLDEVLKYLQTYRTFLSDKQEKAAVGREIDFGMSKVYLGKEDYRGAIKYLNNVIAWDTQKENVGHLWVDYQLLAHSYAMLEDFKNAVFFAREALRIIPDSHRDKKARSYLFLAGIYKEKDLFDLISQKSSTLSSGLFGKDAVDFYKKAQNLVQEISPLGREQRLIKGFSLKGLAQVYRIRKDFNKAIEYYNQAISILLEVKEGQDTLSIRELYLFAGAANREELFPKALWRELKWELANSYMDLAGLYIEEQMEVSKSLNSLKQVNDLIHFEGDSWEEPFTVHNRQKNCKWLERKYDLFLQKVSAKGYRHSDFYKQAALLYEEFKKNRKRLGF